MKKVSYSLQSRERARRWYEKAGIWVKWGKGALVCIWAARGVKYKWRLSVYLLRTFARRLGFQFPLDEEVPVVLGEIKFAFRPLQGELYLYKEIFIDRVYERHPAFRVRAGWCVIDAGANIGLFTLRVAQGNQTGKVYAIEPNPQTFRQLMRNLCLNATGNVVPFQKAVGRHSGDGMLDAGAASTLCRLVDGESIAGCIPVDVVSVARIIEVEELAVVNLLKVDVEGAEADVIWGARGMLSRIERIVMEYHSEPLLRECEEILAEHGFEKVLQVSPSYAYFMQSYCR